MLIQVDKSGCMELCQKSLPRIENLFFQGSYESLERLEGKTGDAPFFERTFYLGWVISHWRGYGLHSRSWK